MKNPSGHGIVAGIANAPSTLACDARLSDITRIATSCARGGAPDAETPKRRGDHSLFRASRQVGQRATGCIQHEPHNRQIEEYDSHPWHGLGGDHAAQREDAAHRATGAESNSHRGTAMHLVTSAMILASHWLGDDANRRSRWSRPTPSRAAGNDDPVWIEPIWRAEHAIGRRWHAESVGRQSHLAGRSRAADARQQHSTAHQHHPPACRADLDAARPELIVSPDSRRRLQTDALTIGIVGCEKPRFVQWSVSRMWRWPITPRTQHVRQTRLGRSPSGTSRAYGTTIRHVFVFSGRLT